MELNTPINRQITLVSAFGRGVWLAAALAKEGLKVTFIDVTSKLGVWPPEDAEGPFGFLRAERLNELQLERIFSEDPYEEATNGVTLWLKNGPVELKSPLTKFYLEKHAFPQAFVEALSSPQKAKGAAYNQALNTLPFEKRWILNIAHQWSATTYLPSAKATQSGKASALLSSFYVRSATRTGVEKSLRWLQEKDVQVLTQTDVVDLSFGAGRTISGLELHTAPGGEKLGNSVSGLHKTDQLVWMLSSEETCFYSEKVSKALFPEGKLEPEWCWVRYRFSIADCPERSQLPLHFIMIGDIDSPWTHHNLAIVQRTALPDQFDVWIRIPNVQRFNKEYLSKASEDVMEQLTQRMSLSAPQVQVYPQEYYYPYSQLGATRFPVYATKQSSSRHGSSFKNCHFDSPEIWAEYSWDEELEKQDLIRQKIMQWWMLQIQKMQNQSGRKEKHP